VSFCNQLQQTIASDRVADPRDESAVVHGINHDCAAAARK
jgi:hypothetical protein